MNTSGRKALSQADLVIGSNIRAYRQELKLTCKELAELVGLSMQQVQKYEVGANKVSASTLYALSDALGVKVETLYAGVNTKSAHDANEESNNPVSQTMFTVFNRIKNEDVKKQILELTKHLAKDNA